MALRHFMESKLLALAVIILFIATLISIFSALSPFWYRLHFGEEDATYGSMPKREADLTIGMFWVFKPGKPGPEKNKVLMTSFTAMDEAVNLPVVPPLFKMGQVFYSMGVFGTATAFGGGMVLACRKLGSVTGNFGLAIFTVLATLFQVLGVVLPVFVSLDSSNTWHTLPLEDPYHIVITSHPTMYIEWGYYIALMGVVVTIFGAILLVIEALKVCKSVEGIRDWQFRTKPAPEPYPDIRYQRFSYEDVPRPKPDYPTYAGGAPAPVAAPYRGVVVSRDYPPQQFIAQPQPSPQPPPYGGYPEYEDRSPAEYKAEEAGYVSRQVDL